MAVNTTKTVGQSKVTDADLQKQIEKLGGTFKGEKKRKVSIPKALIPQLGTELFFGINGVSIVIPVDGKSHEIPETFADHVEKYLENLS
jgi:hypothetical protein